MKKDFLIDFLGLTAVKGLSLLLRCTPLRPALWIGRRAGDIVYHANVRRRMIAYANLKSAFPEKSGKELRRINKAHFQNLAMNAIELLKLPYMSKGYLTRHVKIENIDEIKTSLDKGKGIIILTAHFGNWEIASLALSLNGYTMSVFAREQKYEKLNNFLNELRQSTGCKVITKGFSVKDIVRTLHGNGIVAMLSDQDAGANGAFINFFNRPASTAQGVIAFGSKTGAVILPSFITRIGVDQHIGRLGGKLELIDTGDKEKDTKANLQKIGDILEAQVRKFPEQWLWAHKRWKSTSQRNVLALTDGKAGHFNQAMGVAETIEEALGSRLKARGISEKPIVKIHAAEIKFKNSFAKAFLNISSIFASNRCQGCLRCLKFCLTKESFESVRNRCADIVVSCGASTIAPNIFLKYENNAKNILIMKPGIGQGRKIDLIIMPRHDMLRMAKNILITEGAPNRIRVTSDERRATNNGIGVLIGGDAKGFKLEKKDIEGVLDAIIKISNEKNINIYVSTSRRTSKEIDDLVKEKLGGNKNCKMLIIANEKNIDGAVPAIFGLSDIIITSPESMSMISEAASSGKHVIAFRLKAEGSRLKGKYDRMAENLERQGYIKISPPEKIYNAIKEILETKPVVKKLSDREKITKRIEGIC